LLAHPDVTLTAAASTSVAGQRVEDVLPAFRKLTHLSFTEFNAKLLAEECDVVFVGVPSKESMDPVSELRAEGARVIDIGPDFRLKNAAEFAEYYKTRHTVPTLLAESVYGLPPVYRAELKDAALVAVPGCYPISIVLPLYALLSAPLGEIPVVADSISGISGAGRALNEAFHFPEMNENLKAYKLAVHQHVPEIEQELQHKVKIQFTPHVAPLTRGILSTITVRPTELFDPTPYYAAYAQEPFVRVLGEGLLPEVRHVRGSNFCDIGWVRDTRTGNLIIVSAIDNLMGGTAGMAVQCLNLMFGFDESTGLKHAGMTP